MVRRDWKRMRHFPGVRLRESLPQEKPRFGGAFFFDEPCKNWCQKKPG